MKTSIRSQLFRVPILESMFVRGGTRDSFFLFALGHGMLLVFSSLFSAYMVKLLFRQPYEWLNELWFFRYLAKPHFMVGIASVLWLHEITHLAGFRKFSIPVFGLLLPPVGGIMVPGVKMSKKQIMEAALAGPLSGVAAFPLIVLGAVLKLPILTAMAVFVAGINFINLLPIYPLDGGWFLKALLSYWVKPKTAAWIAYTVTSLVVIVLFVLIPDPRVVILQLILAAMLLIADIVATKIFEGFSKKFFENLKPDETLLTKKDVRDGLSSYVVLLSYLALLLWLSWETLF